MVNRRILVIDDEIDIRDVVCLCLEEFGRWQTGSAGSGQEGIAMAQTSNWDAILLDVSMPDMDGFAVFEKLQIIPSTQTIPVILLTAKVFNEDLPIFTEGGFGGIISKPFDPLEVWRRVADILGWPTGA